MAKGTKGKILIATFSFPPESDGVAFASYLQAKSLLNLGFTVEIVTAATDLIVSKQSEPLVRGVNRYRVYGQSYRGGYQGDAEAYRDFLMRAGKIYDVIIFHCWNTWVTDLAFDLLPNMKAKKILVSHGMAPRKVRSVRGLVRRLLLGPYYRKVPQRMSLFDHVVFLSDKDDKDRFVDFHIARRHGYKRFSIIPNGSSLDSVPLDPAVHFKDEYGISSEKMVLYVSNYSEVKNQMLAVKVFQRADLGDAELVLIGSQKNEYSRIVERYVHRHGLTRRVHILYGLPRVHVKKAYLEADVFLFTSKCEVQPLVIIDSVTLGLPFVSFNVGALDRMRGGIVCGGRDQLVESTVRLVRHQELRKRLSSEASIYEKEFHNWDVISRKYESLITRLLSDEL